ncbi:MAG TPA: GNAT family protein [Solirubrobacteraceae bacterium]
MPSFPHLTRALAREQVILRDAAERDIPEVLIAYQDDPELPARLGRERPPSAAELGQAAEREAAERAAGIGAEFTILAPGSDVCRGQVNVHHVDWQNARGELGIWLSPQSRGMGLGSGALRLLGEWLMRECGMERVELLTEPDNQPMLRAARAARYVHEGMLRSYLLERGQRIDAAILSLIPQDLTS